MKDINKAFVFIFLCAPMYGSSLPENYQDIQPMSRSETMPQSLPPQKSESISSLESLNLPESDFSQEEKAKKAKQAMEQLINELHKLAAQAND